MTAAEPAAPATASTPTFPPVALLATLSLAVVIVGGIVMVSSMPQLPPLIVPVGALVVSGLLFAGAVGTLVTQRRFAWTTFRRVWGWALLAYAVSGGMIEFAFLHNHVSGTPLVLLTVMLLLFVLDVPLIIGFTVARYQPAR